MQVDADHIKSIIEILERVLSGDISPERGLAAWPNIDAETNSTIKRSWHGLSHYAADEDIRSRDEGYAEYQRNLLLADIRRLRKMLEKKSRFDWLGSLKRYFRR